MARSADQIEFYGVLADEAYTHSVRGHKQVRMQVVDTASLVSGAERPHQQNVRATGSLFDGTKAMMIRGELGRGAVVYIIGERIRKPGSSYSAVNEHIKASTIRPVRRGDLVLHS